MATHGRGGVARLVMGSVADKVLRGAPCPVLTMREHPNTLVVEPVRVVEHDAPKRMEDGKWPSVL